MTEVVKRKCTSFFKSGDRILVKNAVSQVHAIMTNASLLLKAYYLEKFDQNFGNLPLQSYSHVLNVDVDLLGVCCDIVRGDKELSTRKSKKGKPDKSEKEVKKEEKKQVQKAVKCKHFEEALGVFQKLGMKAVKTDLSLSHILDYSIATLITAYETNVTCHYPKYVKRYVQCCILKILQMEAPDKETRTLIWKVTKHILYDELLHSDTGLLNLDLEELKSRLIPRGRKADKNVIYDMKSRPWLYLAHMVYINRTLETDFPDVSSNYKKLFSPFPMTTSFIPNHIRLDTSGMAQLLMTSSKIKAFVELYDLTHGIKLNMTNKSDMLKSYASLSGLQPSLKEDAQYMTELWKFNCNMENNTDYKKVFANKRQDELWVFDNSIVTDGYSVSFQVTKEVLFQKKVMFAPKATPVDTKPQVAEDKEFMDLGEEKLNVWLNNNPFFVLGDDPGKTDIMAVTNGVKCITYTKSRRDKDTFLKARNDRSKRLRCQSHVVGSFDGRENPTIHDYESILMSQCKKRSCHGDEFADYIHSWKEMEEEGVLLYSHPYFRQAKFLVYSRTKSSEHNFFNKVKETFLKEEPTTLPTWMKTSDDEIVQAMRREIASPKEGKKLVIAWGNWGRNPNLKNSAPTPGIGIRRRATQHFDMTCTTPEHYTSKTCPCCRTKTLENPKVGKEPIAKHHLLRCTNEACHCRWWNRNTAGSFNILYRAYETFVSAQNLANPDSGSSIRQQRTYRDESELGCPNCK